MTLVLESKSQIRYYPWYLQVNLEESVCTWVMNPELAYEFESAEEAARWLETNTVIRENVEPVDKEEAIEEYKVNLERGFPTYKIYIIANHPMNQLYDPAKHSWQDVIKWTYNYNAHEDPDSVVKYEVYESWPCIFSLDQPIHLHDFTAAYTDPTSRTPSVFAQLVFPRDNTSFIVFKREFEWLIENFKFYTNEDKYIVFDVLVDYKMRDDLCFLYRGSKGKECKIILNGLTIHEGTFKQCYNYLVKNHSYCPRTEDEDDY